MEYIKNELLGQTIDSYLEVWQHLLDSERYVDKVYLAKLDKTIYKSMKKKLKEIDIYYLLTLEKMGVKLSWSQKLKIYFSGLRPIYNAEQIQIEEMKKEENKKLLKEKEEETKREEETLVDDFS